MGRHGEISRITSGGRKISYQLKVIQQPERARACGSGAKSSADRRPVDPPPVVELRIYEGEGAAKEDITFGYSANFFLFATLEIARPIAHGRIHPPPPQQVPVLTGMPVSGMAYLDRPTEAGYFIFPDLSVRHEGAYKLSFNLYEETKLADDADAEPHENKPKIPGAPESSFDWRMEVKSREFTVYSAKKFPGLAESTVLSRTVAEQGCRVRIRRDVRMRRRLEGKPAGDWDAAPPFEEHTRGRQDYDRPRSISSSPNSSPEGSPTRNPGHPNQQYGQYSNPGPQHQNGPHGNLGFPSEGPYSARPHFAAPQPPSLSHQYQRPPGPLAYPQAPQPPPQQHYRSAPQPGYNDHGRSYPQSAYPTNPPREPYNLEPRRASVPHPPQGLRDGPPPRDYPSVESNFNRPSYSQQNYDQRSPPLSTPVNLAPIHPAAIDPQRHQSSPLAPLNAIAPHLPQLPQLYNRPQERSMSNQYSQPEMIPSERRPSINLEPEPPRSSKRPWENAFTSSIPSISKPLHNGERPVTPLAVLASDDKDDYETDSRKMVYRKADGNLTSRVLPLLE